MSAKDDGAPARPGPPDPRSPSVGGRYYGKYRGVVSNNVDELGLGRLMVVVPAVPDALETWAMPCVPYGGIEMGLFTLPEIGANVWVEFESGNPTYPIWCGAFWEEGEFAIPQALSPEDPALIKVLKTLASTAMFNDTPVEGGFTLEVGPPAIEVPILFMINELGIEISCGTTSVLISPQAGITIDCGSTVVSITEAGVQIEGETVNVVSTGEASVTASGPVSITGEPVFIG